MTKSAAHTRRPLVAVPRRGSKGPAAVAAPPTRVGARFGVAADRVRHLNEKPFDGYSSKRIRHVGLQAGVVGRWRGSAIQRFREVMEAVALEIIEKAAAVTWGDRRATVNPEDLLHAFPYATNGRRFLTSGGDAERAFVPHKNARNGGAADEEDEAPAPLPVAAAAPRRSVAHKAPRVKQA